jgi:hypothetical protein
LPAMAEDDESLDWEGVPAVDVTEWPCLDFANSVEPHVTGPKQPFGDYSDVVAWARHEGGPANGVLTAVEDFVAALH